MINNPSFWSSHIQDIFIPEIKIFIKCLSEKVLPAFDRLGEEAEEFEKDEYRRLGELLYDDENGSVAAEKAEDSSIDYYCSMMDMFQGIKNMFAIGLYHLFEQQLLFIYRRELLRPEEEDCINLLKTTKVIKKFNDDGINIENFDSWSKINELRLVNNTVKHADGTSCEELKNLRHDLFFSPFVDNDFINMLNTPSHVYQPLIGQDIYVSKDDLNIYAQSIIRFWSEMISIIKQSQQDR